MHRSTITPPLAALGWILFEIWFGLTQAR